MRYLLLLLLAAQPTTSWLDRPMASWNKPGAAIPHAVVPAGEDVIPGRAARDADERALVAAGWQLVGAAEHKGELHVLRASSTGGDTHFMRAYNLFVFQHGRYAGTVAPAAMTSSTDGAVGGVYDVTRTGFKAAFARYTPQDPLCCPSRKTEVLYKLDGVVKPVKATTSKT